MATLTRSRSTPLVFAVGFASGLFIALCVNLIPYLRSYGAFATDGYEVAGFPATFYQMGGYVGLKEFRGGAFLLDLGLALVVAVFSGWIAAHCFSNTRRSGRGFEVSIKTSTQSPDEQ